LTPSASCAIYLRMHDRFIALEGVLNFRDFGGYATPDGAIARGKLYRSASFHAATDADIARLNELGVRVVVDLRLPMEREHEPSRWPGAHCRTIAKDEEGAVGLPPHLVALLQQDVSAESVRAYMHGAYRGFPFNARHIELFRAWFNELGAGGPAVVHCVAGKDRTGMACALTLHALGADEDTILADYDLTNLALDMGERLPRIKKHMETRIGRAIADEALEPMLGAHADYLRAGLGEIASKHGTLDRYLEDVLGVGARERAALRANFVV
jgi:protein tyrosine/serine phosphatase